jgi:hypothetical protein
MLTKRKGTAVGDHDPAGGWLERWREQEPVRLYLWGIAAAVLPVAVVAGWLTSELAVAITGVVSSALMVGGAAAARRETFAPATVAALRDQWAAETDQLLDQQHAESWRRGAEAALAGVALVERTPDQVAAETREIPALPKLPAPGARPSRCRHVEDGRRCTLGQHPETVGHALEEVGQGE